MKIESSRHVRTKQTNKQRLAFLELLMKPKIGWEYSDLRRLILALAVALFGIADAESGAQQVRAVGCGKNDRIE